MLVDLEAFYKDFKMYCMTTDNVEGLRIIKQTLFDKALNLETFIDDYIEIDLIRASNKDVIREAKRLAFALETLAGDASYIDSFELREIYYLILNYDYEYLKEVFDVVIDESYTMLCKKIHPCESSFIYEIDEKDLEKWYIDLFNLLERYELI